MKFSDIFEVFSRRNKDAEPFTYKVPTTLRNRVILYCADLFSNRRSGLGGQEYTGAFWNEIHQVLLYRHGKLQLDENIVSRSRAEDTIRFLLSCRDEEFLDFVEYIFRVRCLFHIQMEENLIVKELNELFSSENMGYELTDKVEEVVVEPVNEYPFFGQEREVIKVIAHPKIIRKDEQSIHTTIIKPALTLLANPKFKTANQEYLDALEDYKNGDYGDCLTKCGSAFESVMKIICDSKGWRYKQTDTASVLLSTILKNTNLDSFFDQPLLITATLRNKLSKSHGAGTKPKNVSQNIAQYALNSTASAIIFLVNESK